MATTSTFSPRGRLRLPELLGYLSPAFAMLLGAALGAAFEQGGDAAMAIGAIAGFIAALVAARIAIGLDSGLNPGQLRPHPISRISTTFPKE